MSGGYLARGVIVRVVFVLEPTIYVHCVMLFYENNHLRLTFYFYHLCMSLVHKILPDKLVWG